MASWYKLALLKTWKEVVALPMFRREEGQRIAFDSHLVKPFHLLGLGIFETVLLLLHWHDCMLTVVVYPVYTSVLTKLARFPSICFFWPLFVTLHFCLLYHSCNNIWIYSEILVQILSKTGEYHTRLRIEMPTFELSVEESVYAYWSDTAIYTFM